MLTDMKKTAEVALTITAEIILFLIVFGPLIWFALAAIWPKPYPFG